MGKCLVRSQTSLFFLSSVAKEQCFASVILHKILLGSILFHTAISEKVVHWLNFRTVSNPNKKSINIIFHALQQSTMHWYHSVTVVVVLFDALFAPMCWPPSAMVACTQRLCISQEQWFACYATIPSLALKSLEFIFLRHTKYQGRETSSENTDILSNRSVHEVFEIQIIKDLQPQCA